jgi:hypothetical protein
MDIFPLTLTVVTRPARISAYLIPVEQRQEIINFVEHHIENSFACNKSKFSSRNKHTMKKFKSLLQVDDTSLTKNDYQDFIEYTSSFDLIRNQSVLETFPKINFLFKESYFNSTDNDAT